MRCPMESGVGLVRDAEGLQGALNGIERIACTGEDDASRSLVARLIAESALRRTESRGSQFLRDHTGAAAVARRSFIDSLTDRSTA
jgi:aspartate oxidase